MLSSLAEIASAIADNQRLDAWSVDETNDAYCSIRRDGVVMVLASKALWADAGAAAPHWVRARSGNYTLLLLGSDDELEDGAASAVGDEHTASALVSVPLTLNRLQLTLESLYKVHRFRLDLAKRELALERARYERDLLIGVGRSLSQERDTQALLRRILTKAREVTGADAGSVYILEGDGDTPKERTLRFIASENDSNDYESTGFTMSVSEASIVGACVMSASVINIPDLYKLDPPGQGNNPWRFVHDKSWDERANYQTRSMVTVPMISARNEVIGVIQLINKRARGVAELQAAADFENSVLPFDEVSINYATTLSSQAGIALENALLYDEVKTLFEGFVHASVTAIEARDPTTSGHSERVAKLTVGLAKAADRADDSPFQIVRFSPDELKEIEYAALLHDFGKVGVREHVLVKAKKLYPHERQLIHARFEYIRKCIEAEGLSMTVGKLLESSRQKMEAAAGGLDPEFRKRLDELDSYVEFIFKANEPTVLEEGGFERLSVIADNTYRDSSGDERPYLTECEVTALQIARGSLTADERKEIERHVVYSYNFLKEIPWGRSFRDVPEIAGAHHEKLDGSGYPLGLKAEEIPAATRMMTIADIFDALTASDRPYKRAVPTELALDILNSEVGRGKLDGDLYQLFVDTKVWQIVLPAES